MDKKRMAQIIVALVDTKVNDYIMFGHNGIEAIAFAVNDVEMSQAEYQRIMEIANN